MSPRVTGRVGRGNPAGAPAAGLPAESLLFAVTTGSLQDLASDTLGRELTADEIEWIAQRLTLTAGEALDRLVGLLTEASTDEELSSLIRSRRQIAQFWSVAEVIDVRPDLNEDQAWRVLRRVNEQQDASVGITWQTLIEAAAQLYPEEGGAS